jgi:hypothetical protein
VKLHTVVVHMVMVGIAVGTAVPIVAVTHTMEVLATVRVVMVVAGSMVVVAAHRLMAAAGSGHCPSVIPSGISAVPFLKRLV